MHQATKLALFQPRPPAPQARQRPKESSLLEPNASEAGVVAATTQPLRGSLLLGAAAALTEPAVPAPEPTSAAPAPTTAAHAQVVVDVADVVRRLHDAERQRLAFEANDEQVPGSLTALERDLRLSLVDGWFADQGIPRQLQAVDPGPCASLFRGLALATECSSPQLIIADLACYLQRMSGDVAMRGWCLNRVLLHLLSS